MEKRVLKLAQPGMQKLDKIPGIRQNIHVIRIWTAQQRHLTRNKHHKKIPLNERNNFTRKKVLKSEYDTDSKTPHKRRSVLVPKMRPYGTASYLR